VVTPIVQQSNAFQEVDFLGPILEKTAFDLMLEEAKPQAETLYAREALFLDEANLKPAGPERKVLKASMPIEALDRFDFALRDYMTDIKEIPLCFVDDTRSFYGKAKKDIAVPSRIEGPAASREIIFKPESLTMPPGLYSGENEHTVKLKFYVSDKGIVRDVEPVISSGYPEIDMAAMKSIRRWRFSPLSIVEKENPMWGTVTLKIGAR